jgi:SEC-C motif
MAEAEPQFHSEYFSARGDAGPDATWVERIGAWSTFGEQEVLPLRELLQQGRPPRGVIDKTVAAIRAAADSQPADAQTIGKQLSVVVLPAAFSMPPSSEYHTAMNVYAVHSPSVVVAQPGNAFAFMDMEIRAESTDSLPLAVPKVRRNAPCPCGSGRKYKTCHGRFGPGTGGFSVVNSS